RDWSVTGVQTCALPIYDDRKTDRLSHARERDQDVPAHLGGAERLPGTGHHRRRSDDRLAADETEPAGAFEQRKRRDDQCPPELAGPRHHPPASALSDWPRSISQRRPVTRPKAGSETMRLS